MQLSKVTRYTLNHQKFNSKINDIFPYPPNPYLIEFDMFNKKTSGILENSQISGNYLESNYLELLPEIPTKFYWNLEKCWILVKIQKHLVRN